MNCLDFLPLFLCIVCKDTSASPKDVLDHIFVGYDSRIRPVKDNGLPLTIYLEPHIIRLIEVNAQQEYIKLSMSLDQVEALYRTSMAHSNFLQSWTDEFLVWNPADYNGTRIVTVTKTAVWLPDTMISSTSFESEQIVDKDRQMVRLMYDGTIFLSYPFVQSNYCAMETDNYPFDEQHCIIKVSSWLYSKHEILFEPLSNVTNAQNKNSEWDLLPITTTSEDFEVAGESFHQALYTLTIKRKPAYYIWVLIVPTFITTALSIGGIFAPNNNIGDRQEKITLGLTTLLTLAVILSMVTGEMPRATNLPLLGQFVLAEMSFIVVCMALSAVILFLHQRATTRPWPVPFSFAKEIAYSAPKERRNAAVMVLNTLSQRPLSDEEEEEKSRKNLHMVNELKASRKGEGLDIALKLINDAIDKLNRYIDRKASENESREAEELRQYRWLILFDRVDFFFFVVFQFIHVAIYLTLFYR